MRLWWATDGDRLDAEFLAIQRLADEQSWFTLERWALHEANLAAIGTIKAHDHQYPVRLVYPDQFPEVPAWVEPQENVRWSNHQYGEGGILCLELRPDNWVSSATGADVLRSAYALLLHENPLGRAPSEAVVAPSAHQVGEIQAYAWGNHPILISASCHNRIVAGNSADVIALRWMVRDDIWPILIHDGEDRRSPFRAPGADINSWRFEIPVLISSNAPPAGDINRVDVLAAGGFGTDALSARGDSSACVVIFRGESDITAFHIPDGDGAYLRKVFHMADQIGMRSGRAKGAMEKRVAIVGCGSVGSKISESLVRSGTTKLTLIDGDVLLPENLERHALDWRDVGFRKAHGLRRRLLDIVPGADISVVDQNLDWQRSAKTHASQVDTLAGCDIIVDATGSPATALYLGAIASINNHPFVSVEVFEGGIGALIATCLPERDPPYAGAREAFLGWCAQQSAPLPTSGTRAYESVGDDGTPIVADDAAVTMAAGHAARTILDLLDGQPAPPEAAWMLMGFKRGWVFNGHGHSILLSVGAPSVPDVSSRKMSDSQRQVFALLEDYLNARKVAP